MVVPVMGSSVAQRPTPSVNIPVPARTVARRQAPTFIDAAFTV
jgi:hypothetical protein